MKLNILTISPVVLTALLAAVSAKKATLDSKYSYETTRDCLLSKAQEFGYNNYDHIGPDKMKTPPLITNYMAIRMNIVAEKEKEYFSKSEIARFWASSESQGLHDKIFGQIVRYNPREYDETISEQDAKNILLWHAQLAGFNRYNRITLDEEMKEVCNSPLMAAEMIKQADTNKKDALKGEI
ncbi:hypothetical protein IWQ61_009750, partial [Dispira simplex]